MLNNHNILKEVKFDLKESIEPIRAPEPIQEFKQKKKKKKTRIRKRTVYNIPNNVL